MTLGCRSLLQAAYRHINGALEMKKDSMAKKRPTGFILNVACAWCRKWRICRCFQSVDRSPSSSEVVGSGYKLACMQPELPMVPKSARHKSKNAETEQQEPSTRHLLHLLLVDLNTYSIWNSGSKDQYQNGTIRAQRLRDIVPYKQAFRRSRPIRADCLAAGQSREIDNETPIHEIGFISGDHLS